MAILTQHKILNVIPGITPQLTVHCSQGDVGSVVDFELYAGSTPFTPEDAAISVQGIRKDGTGFGPTACIYEENVVSVTIDEAMTSVPGPVVVELTITEESGTVSTANFAILVEAAAFPNGPLVDNSVDVYQQILQYVQSFPAGAAADATAKVAAEAALRQAADQALQASIDAEATARATAVSAEATARAAADTQLQTEISGLQNAVGGPNVALTAADFTDITKVYVVAGTIPGMTTGDWYYWDGTQWVSGGVYNSTAVQTDPTLSVPGMPADAAACGDLKSALNIGMGEPYNYVYTTKKPNNLINKYRLISGEYIDASGDVAYASGWNRTDYIDISDYTHITMTGGIGSSAFYDSSKQFISTVSSQQIGYAVPSGAVYMRCSVSDANLPTALLNGGSVQLAYDDGCVVIPFPKKEYQAGWIEFTVPVNQTIVKFNSTTSNRDDSQDYVNVECVLKLPNTYTPNGVPTKLIMLCHGAGRGVTFPNQSDNKAWVDLDDYNTMVNYFVTNGYAVFDCNGYDNTWLGVNFWGAPKGIEAWRKAYDYVTDNYNVETSFSLFGFSMGGLTACSLMMNGFPNIKCAVLASPVLDLQKCWEDGQTAFMEAGYGMSGSYNPNIVGGSDPMAHLLTIDNVKYCLPKMPPIKIWYGSTETGIAVNKAYAQTLVNAIQASGGFAVYREVAGAGHEICYGGNSNCNLEYYLWINRFNDNYYN